MNALASHDFAVVSAPVHEWLVLRCASSRTLALSAALADRGAWTPTWKVSKQLPRSAARRKVTEACIPGYVFVPVDRSHDLPRVARISYAPVRLASGMFMRVPDAQFDGLRRIADKPLVPQSKLPRIGTSLMMPDGPWQGLKGKVLKCSHRYARLEVTDSFGRSQEITLPTCFLLPGRA